MRCRLLCGDIFIDPLTGEEVKSCENSFTLRKRIRSLGKFNENMMSVCLKKLATVIVINILSVLMILGLKVIQLRLYFKVKLLLIPLDYYSFA